VFAGRGLETLLERQVNAPDAGYSVGYTVDTVDLKGQWHTHFTDPWVPIILLGRLIRAASTLNFAWITVWYLEKQQACRVAIASAAFASYAGETTTLRNSLLVGWSGSGTLERSKECGGIVRRSSGTRRNRTPHNTSGGVAKYPTALWDKLNLNYSAFGTRHSARENPKSSTQETVQLQPITGSVLSAERVENANKEQSRCSTCHTPHTHAAQHLPSVS